MTGFDDWIGRRRETLDILEPARAQALAAALGRGGELAAGERLPQLFHWLYFWDVAAPSDIGSDGHPARGGFLPPVAAPRRMWAAGQLTFHAPLRLGDPVRRVSTVADVTVKQGRSGALTFVAVDHAVHGPAGLAIAERQDIVFRDAPPPGGPQPAAPPEAEREAGDWASSIAADPVLLFRYSALTMNSHRIHYDRPYAVEVEDYPDLVVHGPLMATLMLGAATKAVGAPAAGFSFRALAPAFSGREVTVQGRAADGAVWAEQSGRRTMDGAVRFGAA